MGFSVVLLTQFLLWLPYSGLPPRKTKWIVTEGLSIYGNLRRMSWYFVRIIRVKCLLSSLWASQCIQRLPVSRLIPVYADNGTSGYLTSSDPCISLRLVFTEVVRLWLQKGQDVYSFTSESYSTTTDLEEPRLRPVHHVTFQTSRSRYRLYQWSQDTSHLDQRFPNLSGKFTLSDRNLYPSVLGIGDLTFNVRVK